MPQTVRDIDQLAMLENHFGAGEFKAKSAPKHLHQMGLARMIVRQDLIPLGVGLFDKYPLVSLPVRITRRLSGCWLAYSIPGKAILCDPLDSRS